MTDKTQYGRERLLFAQELQRRTQLNPMEVRPSDVADAIGLDPLEQNIVMMLLLQDRLVKGAGKPARQVLEPETVKPIELTGRGIWFVEHEEVPPLAMQ